MAGAPITPRGKKCKWGNGLEYVTAPSAGFGGCTEGYPSSRPEADCTIFASRPLLAGKCDNSLFKSFRSIAPQRWQHLKIFVWPLQGRKEGPLVALSSLLQQVSLSGEPATFKLVLLMNIFAKVIRQDDRWIEVCS